MAPDKVANEIIRAIKGNRDEVFVGKTNLLYWVSRVSLRMALRMARRIMKRLG
ncbi:hypothetical protein BCM02_11548 [Paenibacillus methanolicus]|uniref:Uncharacterized protein n=1 Tax=Paenibacillus methanolicus TaxID=582686 RepID=A0A5S5BSP6_9BACL|nr:hypothetical protein BCM02_11548 [Paenibacillus methanolicus]